jgi:cytochrome oxidase Cu insertion factor (SCO1/SenC/PrrC family)
MHKQVVGTRRSFCSHGCTSGGIVLGLRAGKSLSVGDLAPEFELPSTSGERVALSDFQGRPVLLFFHMAVG